jgi:N-acetylglucosaminyldiphosphoundecaprenol N-acetyl-beta-D-mannosaminyltransferase
MSDTRVTAEVPVLTRFGVDMHPLTMSETVELIDQRMIEGAFTQHVVVNVAKIVRMQSDEVLSRSVRECDVVNIDGMGVVWGCRFLGAHVPERVAGVDLFHQLVSLAAVRDYPVFLLGAEQEIVAKVASVLQEAHPLLRIAGWHHGYFWNDEHAVVERIKASGARMLFVAITSPKKENFISRWRSELRVDFVMGVGGTFDVVAGKVARAPRWMQRTGLEWFFRILQEPRRMWRRYLTTNTAFAKMLIAEALRHRVASMRER